MYKFDNMLLSYLIESKEQAQKDLSRFNFKIKDFKTIKDKNNQQYEIILVDMDDMYPDSKYQIALQRSDGNAFDISSHDIKLDNKGGDFSVLKK